MSTPVDLHTHSTFSDGQATPDELIDLAAKRGIAALAITDHDTVNAYRDPELFAHAQQVGVELVPGVEISVADNDGHRMHVLGLCIDPESNELNDFLDGLQRERNDYAVNVKQKLEAYGWRVDNDIVEPGQTHTKAHIAGAVVEDPRNAHALRKEFGVIPTRGQFIEAFMNPGLPCYVEKRQPTITEATGIIHQAGGLAFMAHPVAYKYEQSMGMDAIAKALTEGGFDGVEALYYYYYKSGGDVEIDEIDLFRDLAERYSMLISGGSDYHGDSPVVGSYMDIGYEDKTVYPTVELLRAIQSSAQTRQ